MTGARDRGERAPRVAVSGHDRDAALAAALRRCSESGAVITALSCMILVRQGQRTPEQPTVFHDFASWMRAGRERQSIQKAVEKGSERLANVPSLSAFPHGEPIEALADIIAQSAEPEFEERLSAWIERSHRAWRAVAEGRDVKHPAGPLAKAWCAPAADVQIDTRDFGIMPKTFETVRSAEVVTRLTTEGAEHLVAALNRPGFVADPADGIGYLPGLQPPPSRIIPSLPLFLWDQTGAPDGGRGRGAPLALRLFVEILLCVPIRERDDDIRLSIEMRDLIAYLWPNGWSGPSRDGAKLLRALHQLHNARVPWKGGHWAPIAVRNTPRWLSDCVVFEIALPPGSGQGPRIHRPTLRKYGVESAPAYRAFLGLCYLWNRYLTHKGKLIRPDRPAVLRDGAGQILGADGRPATDNSGKLITRYNDPRAVKTGAREPNPMAERMMPELTSDEIIALCYAEPAPRGSARSNQRQRAHETLEAMEADGDIQLVRGKNGWRIFPTDKSR